MRILRFPVGLAVGILLVATPVAVSAQEGRAASGVWNDAYGKTDNQRANDLSAATMQLTARRGGYGNVVQSTTIAGDQNNYTTNNGPQNSSVAYNSVNSNMTTTSANGSGITVSVSTGQTSGQATQNADAKSTVGTMTTTNTCGGPSACPHS